MSSFLVSLQDQGKTNIALKFSKEDGILKYYNDFGDFSCFVQAHPLVVLDVVLITNKGALINHTTHIGKGKRKEGSVFQTNPAVLQTDELGRCNFRAHVYTSCQNTKCLFFMLKISWQVDGETTCLLSSPFVGATKDPNQIPTSLTCSYISSITHDEFLKNGQLTTMIVYNDKPREKNWRRDGKYNHKVGKVPVEEETPDPNTINLIIHQVTSNDEVLSYFKDVSGTNLENVTISMDSVPDATYRLSKARSLSHQTVDNLEINKEVNYNNLEKRAKIFVTQLVNWERRGQISAEER